MNRDAISVDPAKVEALSNWEQPKSVTEILNFLGEEGWMDKLRGKGFLKGYLCAGRTMLNLRDLDDGHETICLDGQDPLLL